MWHREIVFQPGFQAAPIFRWRPLNASPGFSGHCCIASNSAILDLVKLIFWQACFMEVLRNNDHINRSKGVAKNFFVLGRPRFLLTWRVGVLPSYLRHFEYSVKDEARASDLLLVSSLSLSTLTEGTWELLLRELPGNSTSPEGLWASNIIINKTN